MKEDQPPVIMCVFVGVLSVLGAIVLGNDLALYIAPRVGLPDVAVFIGILSLLACGAGAAYYFKRLFWYAGIVALLGASYSLSVLGLLAGRH